MEITDLDSLEFTLHITSDKMPTRSILTINPNSTRSMTDALIPLVNELAFKEVGSHLVIRPKLEISDMKLHSRLHTTFSQHRQVQNPSITRTMPPKAQSTVFQS